MVEPASRSAYRLSPQQRRVWDHQGPDGLLRRAGIALLVEGAVERSALEAALTGLLQRHRVLRTSFRVPSGLRVPAQVEEGEGEAVCLEVLPGDALEPAGSDLLVVGRQAATGPSPVARALWDRCGRGDPLAGGVDAALVPLSPGRHVLFVTVAALAADSPSLERIADEMAELYAAAVDGREPAAPDTQYLQFSEWQNVLLERAGAREAPAAAPLLPWQRSATGAPGPPMEVSRELAADDAAALARLAAELAMPEGALLLAAWSSLQALHGGGSRGAAAHDTASRAHGRAGADPTTDPGGGPSAVVHALVDLRHHPDLSTLFGPARFPLAFPLPAVGAARFLEVAQRAARVTAEGATVPLPADEPVRPAVLFEHEEVAGTRRAAGVAWTPLERSAPAGLAPIRLSCRRRGERIDFALSWRDGVLLPGAADHLLDQLSALLGAAVREPGERIARLFAPCESDRAALAGPCDRAAEAPSDPPSVWARFSARVSAHPDRLAVSWTGGAWTYGELAARANALADRLTALALPPEAPVLVLVGRRPELAVAALGVLAAGCAYLPVDPADPPERLASLLADAAPGALLVAGELPAALVAPSCPVLSLETALPPAAAGLSLDPARGGAADERAAYVIYTSGSTGRPKGVVVSRRALATYLEHCLATYPLGDGAVTPLHTSVGFDLSVTALLGPLVAGGQLRVLPGVDDPVAELAAFLESGETGMVKLTPSHLDALAGRLDEGRRPAAARALVLGGEALMAEALVPWRRSAGPRLINEYGPTEATVGCCVHEVSTADAASGVVPIGLPIAGACMRLLDRDMNVVPAGLPGEIFIGGAGLARGYLGRPALTAAAFLPDPLAGEPGQRLYRSGDLARWLPGLGLEFLGRVDDQLKVRGVRIEPAEVESVLRRHPAVGEAAVTTAEGGAGRAQLVAWVVPAGALPAADELVAHVAAYLPAAMVPDLILPIERLPRSASGKLDRSRLPDPGQAALGRAAYVAPRTAAERRLAAIWCRVLGVDRVGIHDRFFALGGDSILSTQVVFHAAREGLQVTTRQMFEHQSLESLAAVARISAGPAAGAAMRGDVPLTPIQRWFFDLPLTDPAHWNQAVLVEWRRPDRPVVLARAVAAVVAHHGAFTLRFRRDDDGSWRQRVEEGAAGHDVYHEVDLSQLPPEARPAARRRAAEAVQRSFDLERGPLVRFVRFHDGGRRGVPDLLLAVAHHLVVDGVSWRVLLADLLAACRALAKGRPADLAPVPLSFLDWSRHLERRAAELSLADAVPLWHRQLGDPALPGHRLPLDVVPREAPRGGAVGSESGEGGESEASSRSLVVTLPARQTHDLLRRAAAAYRTRPDELMLAALAKAVAEWAGGGTLHVMLEGHGREPGAGGLAEPGRTVGWFTARFPVRLDGAAAGGPGARIKRVKEQVRQVSGRGLEYGLLRYLRQVPELVSVPEPDLAFNYLGRWDGELADGDVALVDGEVGALRDPRARRPHVLSVNAGVLGGELHLTFVYSEALHRRETIRRLADATLGELAALVRHCTSGEGSGVTPSDFPETKIGQEALDDLVSDITAAGQLP